MAQTNWVFRTWRTRPQSDWSPIGILVFSTNWSPKFQNEPILVKNVKKTATEYIPLYKYGKKMKLLISRQAQFFRKPGQKSRFFLIFGFFVKIRVILKLNTWQFKRFKLSKMPKF